MDLFRNDSGNVPWDKFNDASAFYHKNVIPRAVVGTTCILSMTGALLITLSYCLSRRLRSQTRLVLLHLSLMDFGTALANFVGIAVNFDGYYINALASHESVSPAIHYSCLAEAVLACFCTNSSVLWTLSVAVYLHFRIVTDSHRSERFYRIFLYLLCLFNYGFPLVLTLWMALTHRLGFSPFDSSGWCSLIVYKSRFMLNQNTVHVDKIGAFFGSDMLIMITVVIIPFLYFSIRSRAKSQLYSVVTENQSNLKNKLQSIDLKFTAIPVLFIFLRVWSLILGLMYDYIEVNDDSVPNELKVILIYLSGVGDSGQGAVNGIIFVLFTKKARQILLDVICCCRKRQSIDESDEIKESEGDNERQAILITNSSSHQKYEAGGRTLYFIQSH